MATRSDNSVLGYLRQMALRQDGAGLSDGELLERFRSGRDEAAFEALLRRHGPMVLAVCGRLLANSADAEDAFQATFLVLLRKASSINPPQKVGSFLYGVAYRTARRLQALRALRQLKENDLRASARWDGDKVEEHLLKVLDDELYALPDKYRLPIVLCELEGKTRKEAARQLGCAEGTVASRLARGRKMLARHLARRGLVLSTGGLVAALSQQTAPACVPPLLIVSTVEAAARVAAGEAAASVFSTGMAALAEGVVKSMFLSKLKWAGVCIVMMALLGTGVGRFAYRGLAVAQAPSAPPSRSVKPAKPIPPAPKAPGQTRQLLAEALEAARTVEDKQWKAWTLMTIAVEHAKTSDKLAADRIFKEAVEAAKDIREPHEYAKYHTTHEIAGHMARAGDIEGRRKIVKTIEHEDSRDYGLMEVAAAQARAGDVKGALKTAETIGTERHKAAALRVVVEVYAQAGRLKEAATLAETIGEDFDRAFALVIIARARDKAKDRVTARKDHAEALKIADGIEKGDGRAVTYGAVAEAQAEMGDVENALKTANAIKNDGWKDSALVHVAAAHAKAGDLQGARETAATIHAEYYRGQATNQIVVALLRAGDVQQARKTAESIDNVGWEVKSLLEIARFQAKAGDRASADKTFQKAFQSAENVRDDEPGIGNIQNAVLSDIVKAQAEVGEEKQALAWIAKQSSPVLKTQVLLGVVRGLATKNEARQKPRE